MVALMAELMVVATAMQVIYKIVLMTIAVQSPGLVMVLQIVKIKLTAVI